MTKSLSFPISMVFNCCCILVFLGSVLLDWITQNSTPGQPQMFLLAASPTLELPPAGSPDELMSSSGLPKPRDCCKRKFVLSTAPTNSLMKQRRYLVFPEKHRNNPEESKGFHHSLESNGCSKNWDSLQVLMWGKIWLSQHYHWGYTWHKTLI